MSACEKVVRLVEALAGKRILFVQIACCGLSGRVGLISQVIVRLARAGC